MQSSASKPVEFLEFLCGLGWIVNPKTHPGFTGKLRPSKTEDSARPVGLSAQIPSHPFPYYADAMTELAFVTPTLCHSAGDSSASLRSVESSDSNQDMSASSIAQAVVTTTVPQPVLLTQASQPLPSPGASSVHDNSSVSSGNKRDSVYINIDSFPAKPSPAGSGVSESSAIAEGWSTYPASRTKKHISLQAPPTANETPRRRGAVPQDCAAMVVWLERLEDHVSFPAGVLSGLLHGASLFGLGSHKATHGATFSKKCLPVIFIHKMSSGLYQVVTNNSGGR